MKKLLAICSVICSLITACSLEDMEEIDSDGDTIPDALDECPDNPDKQVEGRCGCGVEETDTDGDGEPDCKDGCVDDPNKRDPGTCGCGVPDDDDDGDGTPNCIDKCENDPNKRDPGVCGCGVSDNDRDEDGVPDCNDECPDNPNAIKGSVCVCDSEDTDGDGVLDCADECPEDPEKEKKGACGCGVPETDTDNDTVPDCNDKCPDDPDKSEPGICGCGIPDEVDGIMNKGCYENFDGDTSRFDNSPEGDLDDDGVINDEDFCPYNPKIKDEKDYNTVGNQSCASYIDKQVDIYPGSFIDSELINKNNIKQIVIHGTVDLNYRTKFEYTNDKGHIDMFEEPQSLWGDKYGKENTSISLPEGINIKGEDDAKLVYTYNERDSDKETRAFLAAPLFSNLNKNTISDLLIDIDFYNKNNSGKNVLHAALANTITATKLERVGFSGKLDTALDTKGESHSYGCLVGKVDKDSVLTDIYVDCKELKTSGDYVGGVAGIVESNYPISVKTLNVGTIYTNEDKRSFIGGLFGLVRGSGNITVDKASIGTVSGNMDIGGLVGIHRGKGKYTVNQLKVDLVSGKTEDVGKNIGGLIGVAEGGTCYIDSTNVDIGTIRCKDDCAGIIGYLNVSEFSLSNIQSHVKLLRGKNFLGGIAGDALFKMMDGTSEFTKIINHVESIEFDDSSTSGDYLVGGMLGRLKMTGGNTTGIVSFSNVISTVDNFEFKRTNAGLIGEMTRGDDKRKKNISLINVLSIVKNSKEIATSSNFAGLIASLSDYMHIKAQNVVSVAMLPDSAKAHALFASYAGEDRFTPKNVYWYQFGGYSDATKLTAEAVPEVNNISSANLDDAVSKLNAMYGTKWEVKKDVMFGGKAFDIPWLSW